MEQIGIAICGVAAIWLSQSGNETQRKYGPILGLLGQPFWFYTSWIHEQWGVFALSFFYTLSWARGIKTYWLDDCKQL